MIDIKPVAYTSQIDLDRVRKGKSGDIYGSQKWEGSDNAVFTVPLYTAEQLAKAVAAERERCAKLCEDKRSLIISSQGSHDENRSALTVLYEISGKIRSTAQ